MFYNIDQTAHLPLDLTQNTDKHFTLMHLVYDDKTGKTNKVPVDIYNKGANLSYVKHPERLASFADAVSIWKQLTPSTQQVLRLGVLLQHNWEGDKDLIVVDIDHRKDLVEQARAGKITSTDVQAKVVQFCLDNDFYIEVSQSCAGLHCMQLGHKHNEKNIRNKQFEYYSNARWMTLTGDCIHTTSDNSLGVTDDVFEKLEALMFPPKPQQKSADTSTQKPSSSKKVTNSSTKTMTADEIINKAINAENGNKFTDLFNGSSPSGDVSSDDMAFCNMLAFWTQKDASLMDEIFRKSNRMRSKWDEKHSSDGTTYGQMTIEKAIDNVKDTYQPKKKPETDKEPAEQIDKSKIKSNQDLINALARARSIWNEQNTFQNKNGTMTTIPITSEPTEIIKILVTIVNFAVIYNNDPKVDRNLYFYDYDLGIYSHDENDLETLVLAVVPEMMNTKTRQNLLDTIFKMPSSKIPIVQNVISSKDGRYLLAVGNGLLNLKTKKLTPFSPDIYVTSKIDTNYNENTTTEPNYNGWQWSHSLKVISDGDLDKLNLLWQVCKAALCGAYWLRQAVLLVDDGHGMTGKSTFEDALIGVVGKSNTAQLRLSEMSDETKLVDAVDKRLIVGDDNDVYTVINRYDYLNPVISSELIRVRNYYQKSQSTTLHCFVLQSCNGIPPFKNATQAFFNRLVLIQFNHRHNSSDIGDWRVKNDYIKRKEFKEWLLWYVVNKVDLGISLTTTQENKDLINDAQTETDTIKNFVENQLPKLKSTVIPTPFMYDFYATCCSMESMEALSRKRFNREIMNNDLFASQWTKKSKRPVPRVDFLYDDAKTLLDMYSSTRWGKDLKTWFPLTHKTIKDDDDSSHSFTTITDEDFTSKINQYRGLCFVKK